MKLKTNCSWEHPYTPDPQYGKRVAYFSMEFGIDQTLKTYSGGLGYLAGSHMQASYDLKQNMIGIGMLWKFGYYDQIRDQSGNMRALFRERYYNYLQPTDLVFPVDINGHTVNVQAYYLPPEIFGTIPMYFLSTDRPELNDYLACTITHHLYDQNPAARIAQSIVLGVGGAKVVEALGGADVYHMNEAHALPLAFHLYNEHGSEEAVRQRLAFTTHTPVKAGNEERDFEHMFKMGFFSGISKEKVREMTKEEGDRFGYTPAAIRLSGAVNGVSQLHAKVSEEMWSDVEPRPPIIGITNSQHQGKWQDKQLKAALDAGDDKALWARKRELKQDLFEIVAEQTGKRLDPDKLTIVWARRFAGYKRADLIMRDLTRFYDLLNDGSLPVQIIWAGKPYPHDESAVEMFNKLINTTRYSDTATVLTGYEMGLSAALKKGSDVWLNTPRRPKEASGTSGMTAAMNLSVNFSIDDGWIPEFGKHGHNSFIIPPADDTQSVQAQDDHDHFHLMRILEDEIIPLYYQKHEKWLEIAKNSMKEVVEDFEAHRQAAEYYDRLYSQVGVPQLA
ncbi:MAG: alpha-glucan family phosphorylase [Bacteroidia bacterium]